MRGYPVQCKCCSVMCRHGWDLRVEFESPEDARAGGWIVTGDWPRWHTICPEHAEELRANVRRIARSEPLSEEIFGVAV